MNCSTLSLVLKKKKCLLCKSLGWANVVVLFFQTPRQQLNSSVLRAQAACWCLLLTAVLFPLVAHSDVPQEVHASRFTVVCVCAVCVHACVRAMPLNMLALGRIFWSYKSFKHTCIVQVTHLKSGAQSRLWGHTGQMAYLSAALKHQMESIGPRLLFNPNVHLGLLT